MLGEIKVTVGEELGVGRVVVLLVELDELLVAQVSDVLGVTA